VKKGQLKFDEFFGAYCFFPLDISKSIHHGFTKFGTNDDLEAPLCEYDIGSKRSKVKVTGLENV